MTESVALTPDEYAEVLHFGLAEPESIGDEIRDAIERLAKLAVGYDVVNGWLVDSTDAASLEDLVPLTNDPLMVVQFSSADPIVATLQRFLDLGEPVEFEEAIVALARAINQVVTS